jgi:hypothetical protein
MLDQVLLALPRSAFNLFFSGDCGGDIVASFVIYQFGDMVTLGEAGGVLFFMFIYPANQIIGYASVKHRVSMVSHDIDVILMVQQT